MPWLKSESLSWARLARSGDEWHNSLGEAEDYLRVMTDLGLDREQVFGEIVAFAALRSTGDAELTDTSERLTQRAPKTFEAYAADAAARGAWASAGH